MEKPLIDPEAIGVEVSWSFGNGNADAVRIARADVIRVFAANGFGGHAPAAQKTIDEVLRDVRRKAGGGKQIVVRDLARPHKDTPRALGVYVRRASNLVPGATVADESGDDWEMVARLRGHRGTIACLPPEGKSSYASDSLAIRALGEAMRLRDMGEALMNEVHNGDLSDAIVSACRSVGCIDRRPGAGGVYLIFAKSSQCGAFVHLLHDLEEITSQRHYTQRFNAQVQEVYPKPLTVRSWAESTEAVLLNQIAGFMADINAMLTEGKMRISTMGRRERAAEEACQLAEQSRVFLAGVSDEMKAQLHRVRDAFKAAQANNFKLAEDALAAFEKEHGKVVSAPKKAAEFEAVNPQAEEKPAPVEARKRGKRAIDDVDQLFAEMLGT